MSDFLFFKFDVTKIVFVFCTNGLNRYLMIDHRPDDVIHGFSNFFNPNQFSFYV